MDLDRKTNDNSISTDSQSDRINAFENVGRAGLRGC